MARKNKKEIAKQVASMRDENCGKDGG